MYFKETNLKKVIGYELILFQRKETSFSDTFRGGIYNL